MALINLKDIINDSFLSSGNDLVLDNIIIKHPTVGEILNLNNGILSVRKYFQMVSLLICDPYDKMVDLDDNGINYQNVDNFDVFVFQWSNAISQYEEFNDDIKQIYNPLLPIKEALCFFLGNHNFDIRKIDNDLCLVDLDSVKNNVCHYCITREVYNIFSEFLNSINDINHSERINPNDESTRRMLIEDMRDELNRKSRNQNDDNKIIDNYIGNMINKVSFGGNGGINIFNVNNLKIYQLISAYKTIMKKYNADHLYNGIYAGTINTKSISEKDLNW